MTKTIGTILLSLVLLGTLAACGPIMNWTTVCPSTT